MPKAHRVGDKRYCGAFTIDDGLNTTVFVNNVLWGVEGNQSSHVKGNLISVYGKRNIFIGQRRAIVVGDRAAPDLPQTIQTENGPVTQDLHPFPPTDPMTGSPNVICYNAEQSGDVKVS